MAVPVYSVRFFLKTNTTSWWYWTVPAGRRAVITDAALVGDGVANSDFYATIGGVYVVFVVVPGSNPSYFFRTRQVAYAGEILGVKMGRSNCHFALSGYLFADDAITQKEAAAWVPGEPPEGWEAMEPLPNSTPRPALPA